MPALGSDHHHYTLNPRHHTPPPASHNTSFDTAGFSPSSSEIPPLPSYAYRTPVQKRSSIPTSTSSHAPGTRPNGRSTTPRDEDSPDPRDFYRHHQNSIGSNVMKGVGHGTSKVETRNGDKTGSRISEQPSPMSTRHNGPKVPPSGSRVTRSRHDSPTIPLSSGASKSSPTLSSTARNRQTSLKELVNKFNQNPDEIPPLPSKPPSRSPSVSSNPTGTAVGARKDSQNRSISDGSATKSSISSEPGSKKDARFQQRRGRPSNTDSTNKNSTREQKSRPMETVPAKPLTSQSMLELAPDIAALPRRPLFGEISGSESVRTYHPGYGISGPRRRRGSEGSMHSPNPMFPEESQEQSSSPAPAMNSDYYLGDAPTLEDLRAADSSSDSPANIHRRTHSDVSGVVTRPPASKILGTNLSPPLSPTSTNTSKRSSQSRIPISTRRLSTTSDSGNSNTSTRNNSALGMAQIKSSARVRAAPPKPLYTSHSPPSHSRSTTPQKSPRRSDYSSVSSRPSISPRLTAYISAPMPKKSPPLRSSRPRQPVSSASTSASRARAVERFSGPENSNTRGARDSKPRKPHELGAVDFAARRQKIQQAFTKTVQENEREEERRASMIIASRSTDSLLKIEAHDAGEPQLEPTQEMENENENIDLPADKEPHAPAENAPTPEQTLTLDTGHLDACIEDSPTLGTFTRFSTDKQATDGGAVTPLTDIEEPKSAITARTSDSVDTFFEDDEPQEDWRESSPDRSIERPTVVTQNLDVQDVKDLLPTAQQAASIEGSISERDDQESIQIMLGETPVLEDGPFRNQDDDKLQDPSFSNGPDNRWSTVSWGFPGKSKDERDTPMERIDENSPSKPSLPTHLSISTSTSEQTQQPWSPDSFTSPKTARTTMDSDAYSTINRVLDHYHDPNVVSPEMIYDVQQELVSQSPELARQGGWDPKKVTQLYLQKLAKDRHPQSGTTQNPLQTRIRERTSSLSVPPPVAEKEVRADMDEKMVQEVENNLEHNRNHSMSSTNNLDVDYTDWKPARASLSNPGDWDMSPSLSGLELQAADSPADAEERPTLPPKDYHLTNSKLESGHRMTGSHPQLPPIEGLGGLAIKILPPQRSDSPTIPPPFPVHSPPPPPVESEDQYEYPQTVRPRSPPSPSVYSRYPSSMYPARADDSVPPLPQNETTRQRRSDTPSAPPSISSSKSQDPSFDASLRQPEEVAKPSSAEQKRLTRRKHIIKELVDTEQSFGQDMKVVDDIYKGTSNVIIISGEDVKTLFGNSDQIVSFSTDFLDSLKQAAKPTYILPKTKRFRSNRVSNSTTNSGNTDDQSSISGAELNDDDKDRRTSIGEAFREQMGPMEKVYSDYLKNHDAANQKLQILQKNPKVQIWLKECRAYATDLTTAWDLDSLLVKPVQRVLKYPLLLDQLIEVTPENHPDYTALDIAAREMKGMSMRINEMKKRADLFEQATTNLRKRKESDVRIGFSKAFGRRTEKLRQQVGLSDTVEDKAYAMISEKFGVHFFQLQLVMRDVEMYTNDVQVFMDRFCDFVLAMEAHIDVGQTSYPEVESKWRKFRMSTREMSQAALSDHISNVRKYVVEPMITLVKLHDGPQKLMAKRDKRVPDYALFKAIKDRGDKPDKKIVEQGEQFMAINDTLKDELPKLFALTGKLVAACLNNFVQLQLQWQNIWRRRLRQAIGEVEASSSAQEIVNSFMGDFKFFEDQVESLGICDGTMLSDTANMMSFSSPSSTLNGSNFHTLRQGSIDSRHRAHSLSSEKSPSLPQPDFGYHGGGSFFAVGDTSISSLQREPSRRMRASSNVSGHSPRTPEVPGSYRSYSNSTTPINATPGRAPLSTGRTVTDPSPSLRPSTDNGRGSRLSDDSTLAPRPSPGTSYHHMHPRPGSPSNRFSGFFSSAMPMSDSPPTNSPTIIPNQKDFNVIFLAASVYEFKIDKARREAGYPYLTYVAGEIFDVIGEKGELWLAKNQDDGDNEVGWIWNKHFAKLAS